MLQAYVIAMTTMVKEDKKSKIRISLL